MAEELKIAVSAPGASDAAKALAEVADAENRVAEATAGGAVHSKAAANLEKESADRTHELHEKKQELLGTLRELGPQFGVLADTLEMVSQAENMGATSLGIMGLAITAVTFGISKLADVESERRHRMQEVLNVLEAERKGYEDLERAVMGATLAEERRYGGAPRTASVSGTIGRVAQIGTDVPLGKGGIEMVSKALSSSRVPFTAREEQAFAMWYYDFGQGLPEESLVPMFRAWWSANPNGEADLRNRMNVAISRNPAGAPAARHEAHGLVAGQDPAAATEGLLKQVGERETLAGRTGFYGGARDKEDIRRYILYLAGQMGNEETMGGAEQKMRDLLGNYPEVGEIQLHDDPWSFSQYRVARKGEKGQTVNQMFNVGGVHTHIYGQDDPAGVPAEGTTGNTGR